MPVTIKTANMKYKNSNGEYVGINAIAETKIEEQIAAIQSAGTIAMNSVQAKGVETLATIPDDYTELNNKIESVKKLYSPIGIESFTVSFGKATVSNNTYNYSTTEYSVHIKDTDGLNIKKGDCLFFFNSNTNNITACNLFSNYTQITYGPDIANNGYVFTSDYNNVVFTISSNTKFIINEWSPQVLIIRKNKITNSIINSDISDLQNDVNKAIGIDTFIVEKGKVSVNNNVYSYDTSNNYGLFVRDTAHINVNKNDLIVFITPNDIQVSSIRIYSSGKILSSTIADIDGFVFDNDYNDIVIRINK